MKSLKSKVAIVTGGARGIGKEISSHLLAQDYNVVIADLDGKALTKDPRLLFVKTDVRSESSVKKMIQKTLHHFGKIDALINNAGLLPDDLPPIEKMPLETWEKFIDTNLTGAFICSKHAIASLRQQKGNIINIASTRAFQSIGNDAPYSSAKGGLVAFTQALAIHLGPEIRANAISPGWIHTEKAPLRKKDHAQHPVGRVGKPSDVAHLVSFLLSDQAGYITGQNYVIDGGMTVKMIYLD